MWFFIHVWQHACFECGEAGRHRNGAELASDHPEITASAGASNVSSSTIQVFRCLHANCRRFYHLPCVWKSSYTTIDDPPLPPIFLQNKIDIPDSSNSVSSVDTEMLDTGSPPSAFLLASDAMEHLEADSEPLSNAEPGNISNVITTPLDVGIIAEESVHIGSSALIVPGVDGGARRSRFST